jgi:hypothetical protein
MKMPFIFIAMLSSANLFAAAHLQNFSFDSIHWRSFISTHTFKMPVQIFEHRRNKHLHLTHNSIAVAPDQSDLNKLCSRLHELHKIKPNDVFKNSKGIAFCSLRYTLAGTLTQQYIFTTSLDNQTSVQYITWTGDEKTFGSIEKSLLAFIASMELKTP